MKASIGKKKLAWCVNLKRFEVLQPVICFNLSCFVELALNVISNLQVSIHSVGFEWRRLLLLQAIWKQIVKGNN